MLGGRAWGDAVRVPFLTDIEIAYRFLLALPLLIVAELVVHQRMRPVARQFLERGLIPERSRARFDAALRLGHAPPELGRGGSAADRVRVPRRRALCLASVTSPWMCRRGTRCPTGGGRQLSPAGWWLVYVSLPLFQFILFRWYFRLFVWMRFLWQVTRCDLSLVPTHPDRAGGLGFLSVTVVAFAPVLLAHGVLLAGLIADRIFFHGAKLPDFKVQLVVIVVFLLIIVLGPLLLFMPHLGVGEARRPARVRHPGPALRAGVRRQVASRGRAGGRAAGGERRHPVPRGPGQ